MNRSSARGRAAVITPGAIWRDTDGQPINAHGGCVLWHEGLYHWFGEHKVSGPAGNRAQVGVHVYTSADLVHWRDAGICLPVSESPADELARGCILERPKVLYNASTGQFVMWFHLELPGRGYGSARCGVAVADAPCGPYRYLGSHRPNAGAWPQNIGLAPRQPLPEARCAEIEALGLCGAPVPWCPSHELFRRDFQGGQMARDMTLFKDADGTGYQVYASEENSTLHISRLSDDYLGHAGHYVRVLPGRFQEAPALMRWQDRYWLFTSGCTGWSPNMTGLSVADSLFGPWQELGSPLLGRGADIATSYGSQPNFILPPCGGHQAYIYMADRWRPQAPEDSRHVWLPIEMRHGTPTVSWQRRWSPTAAA